MALQDANTAAVLQSHMFAEWFEQTAHTGPPGDLGAGTAMKVGLRALVKVILREQVSKRTTRVTADSFDAGDTYTITLDGTAHAIAAPASLDGLVVAWETAINAAHTGVITALAVDANDSPSPGTNTHVLITGDADTDYTLAIAVTGGGTGTIDAVADASNCTARLYGVNEPLGATGSWSEVRWPKTDLVDLPVGQHGLTERLNISSMPRMYVELADIFGDYDGIPGAGATLTYNARVMWGPSALSGV